MPALCVVDDVIFRAKIEAAAAALGMSLTFANDAQVARQPGASWRLALIDLNLARGDALMMIRELRQAHPDLPVIGYCSHVQRELQRHALEAGCTTVLPRSAFVRQLPELLRLAGDRRH